jgi:hypothetical protein
MSFNKQTQWCWLWGLAMVPVLVIMGGGAAVIAHHLVHMLEIISYLIMLEMAIFIGIGGMIRPLTKQLYHSAFERVALLRRLAGLPVLRHWFWLTPQGRNRDA